MRARSKQTSPSERRDASERVAARLRGLTALGTAPIVAAFAALPDEIDLGAVAAWLLNAGRRLVMPRFSPATGAYEMAYCRDLGLLTPGRCSIPEPPPTAPVATSDDLRRGTAWLVPGLAFTLAGDRLGRGAGYYDRLLTGVEGPRIGIGFDWQILPELPTAPHDVPLTDLVTDRRTHQCTPEPKP